MSEKTDIGTVSAKALVRKALEEAAKVCDERADELAKRMLATDGPTWERMLAARANVVECANRIRAKAEAL